MADWLIKNGFLSIDWYVSECEWYYDSWVCPPCFCIPYASAGSGLPPKWSGRLDPLQERKEKRRKTGEEPSDSDSEDMEELLGRFSNVQQAHCRGRRWMYWLASTNALLRELEGINPGEEQALDLGMGCFFCKKVHQMDKCTTFCEMILPFLVVSRNFKKYETTMCS